MWPGAIAPRSYEFKPDSWAALSVSGNDEIDRASRLVTGMKDAFADLALKRAT